MCDRHFHDPNSSPPTSNQLRRWAKIGKPARSNTVNIRFLRSPPNPQSNCHRRYFIKCITFNLELLSANLTFFSFSSPSSDYLKLKTPSSTSKSTDPGRTNAGPRASLVEPKKDKKTSYMLDQWKTSSTESDPWKSLRATSGQTWTLKHRFMLQLLWDRVL